MFEGQRSDGINLYAPLWNTSLRFTPSDPLPASGYPSDRGTTSSGGQLWLRADPVAARSQVLFHSIFGLGSMVSWLIVILINGWQRLDSCPNTGSIASPSHACSLHCFLPCLGGPEGGLSMKLSSHSSVYTLQPFPDPVNVLSVSWHTCSLNNDPVVKSCTNKEPTAFE